MVQLFLCLNGVLTDLEGGVAEDIMICMDCKGRAIDNVFVEPSGRTLKNNRLHLVRPTDGPVPCASCQRFMGAYNNNRLHSYRD
ncbi:MAG TPA: hypothetical protein PLB89_15020 [Flavobacteriales bacterium]|nr:hypothetical protein [Flavobacteriales bacterium]